MFRKTKLKSQRRKNGLRVNAANGGLAANAAPEANAVHRLQQLMKPARLLRSKAPVHLNHRAEPSREPAASAQMTTAPSVPFRVQKAAEVKVGVSAVVSKAA